MILVTLLVHQVLMMQNMKCQSEQQQQQSSISTCIVLQPKCFGYIQNVLFNFGGISLIYSCIISEI